LASVGALIAGPAVASAEHYTQLDVPFTDASQTEALGLNDRGQVVGRYDDADGVTQGFLREVNGRYVALSPPAGAVFNAPRDINDAGDIVGRYLDGDRVSHGYVLHHGVYTIVDFPGAVSTRVRGISNRGVITGNFFYDDGVERGFITDGSTYTEVDYPGSAGTDIWDANAVNVNVGDWTDDDGNVHALTLKNGRFSSFDLTIFADIWATSFRGINAKGDVAGVYAFDLDNDHGFLLDRHGHVLTIDFPGAPSTDPMSVNSSGVVAGLFFDEEYMAHGFLVSGLNGKK
jgi:hypothetical protein